MTLNPKLDAEHHHFVRSFDQGARCTFYGETFLAPPGVYKPVADSSTDLLWRSMAQLLQISSGPLAHEKTPPKGFSVVEIGAGSGAVSILLKKRFPWIHVTASDISPRACATMECNALLHDVDIQVVEGDVWAPFPPDKTFDAAIFNVPLLDKPIEDTNELALCDPDGRLLHDFLLGLNTHVQSEGCALFLHATFSAPIPLLPGHLEVVLEDTRPSGDVFRSLLWRN